MLFQVLAVAFGLLSAGFLFFSGQIRAFFARIRRSAREQGQGEALTSLSGADMEPIEEPGQLSDPTQ
jgi:hypothetical protein